MSNRDYLQLSTAQLLKKRFKEAKEELLQYEEVNVSQFISMVIQNEPVYNCPEGWKKIENAWYGKTPDLRCTEIIQGVVRTLKKVA
jgi:hypothetical protein